MKTVPATIVWGRPTRRAFVAMLGAAAAALALPAPTRDPEPPRDAPKTRWIGHF